MLVSWQYVRVPGIRHPSHGTLSGYHRDRWRCRLPWRWEGGWDQGPGAKWPTLCHTWRWEVLHASPCIEDSVGLREQTFSFVMLGLFCLIIVDLIHLIVLSTKFWICGMCRSVVPDCLVTERTFRYCRKCIHLEFPHFDEQTVKCVKGFNSVSTIENNIPRLSESDQVNIQTVWVTTSRSLLMYGCMFVCVCACVWMCGH